MALLLASAAGGAIGYLCLVGRVHRRLAKGGADPRPHRPGAAVPCGGARDDIAPRPPLQKRAAPRARDGVALLRGAVRARLPGELRRDAAVARAARPPRHRRAQRGQGAARGCAGRAAASGELPDRGARQDGALALREDGAARQARARPVRAACHRGHRRRGGAPRQLGGLLAGRLLAKWPLRRGGAPRGRGGARRAAVAAEPPGQGLRPAAQAQRLPEPPPAPDAAQWRATGGASAHAVHA
mmetsp:Transcript_12708/g.29938  ORF Transcript_12708/g.29938 Transcript_12708/m.29938 type:complete len:242 (-) Transcript_12708:312-1037(-)